MLRTAFYVQFEDAVSRGRRQGCLKILLKRLLIFQFDETINDTIRNREYKNNNRSTS